MHSSCLIENVVSLVRPGSIGLVWFWFWRVGAGTDVAPAPSCGTLGQSLHLWGHKFPHLLVKGNSDTFHEVVKIK